MREGYDWVSSGVDVFDTNGLNLLYHLDVPASGIEVLPHEQHLAIHLSWPAHGNEPALHAMSIRDAEGLAEPGQVALESAFQFVGCSSDASPAYVYRAVQKTSGTSEQQLQDVDVATQKVIVVRPFGQGTQNNYVQVISTRPNADGFGTWN